MLRQGTTIRTSEFQRKDRWLKEPNKQKLATKLKNKKNQLDITYYFIVLLIGSTCFGHYYAHHQEFATMILITTLVVSFLVCCILVVRCGYAGVVSGMQAKALACSLDTTPA